MLGVRTHREPRDASPSWRALVVGLLRLGAAFGLAAWLVGSWSLGRGPSSSGASGRGPSTAVSARACAAATHQLTPTGSHVTRHAYDGGAVSERCDGGSDDRSHGRDASLALAPLPGSVLASFRVAATSLPVFSANRSHGAGADVAIPPSRAPPRDSANV